MTAEPKAHDFDSMIYLARAYSLTAEHLDIFAVVDQIEYVYKVENKSRNEPLEHEVLSALERGKGFGQGVYRRAAAALVTQGIETLGLGFSEAMTKIAGFLTKAESRAESNKDVLGTLGVLFKGLEGAWQSMPRLRDGLLERSIGSYWVSAIVLRALAVEILLKALTYKKTGCYEKAHDLQKLFKDLNDALDADTKERIRDLEIQHKTNLEKTLEKHRDDLVTFRYAYEKPGIKAAIRGDMLRVESILYTLVLDELSRDDSETPNP